MNDLTKNAITYLYEEALKHPVYSEDFLNNTKILSKMYMENFGMTQIWLDYHSSCFEDKLKTLNLLKVMFSELLKL